MASVYNSHDTISIPDFKLITYVPMENQITDFLKQALFTDTHSFELIDSVVNVEEQLDHHGQATKHRNKNRPNYRKVEDGYGDADSSR